MATANEHEPEQDRKKKQHRSPAYPSMSLEKAIGHAVTIYKHEKKSSAPVSVVAQHCGTDIKSSKGLRLIAALKQFGLVVEEGSGDDRQVRLTERALDILPQTNADEAVFDKAVKAAALAPAIHKKIWDHYKGILPSDGSLRVHLIRRLEFNDTYADRFIKQFRATLAFAQLTEGDKIDNEGDDAEDDGDDSPPDMLGQLIGDPFPRKKPKGSPPKPTTGPAMKDLPITLPSLAVAVLRVPVPMTDDDFQALSTMLAAFKPSLTKKPDTVADQQTGDEPEEE